MSDYIVRATAANSQVRAFAAVTKETVETARKAHNTSPVATAALGRQMCIRDSLGYVPQKGVLFSGTIDSNIRYGKTDISEEQVKKAAMVAQAQDFIEEKPHGYESPVAQGGTNVSGGQKPVSYTHLSIRIWMICLLQTHQSRS